MSDPFNEHYERWCKISFIKHFELGFQDKTSFFVEGFARNTDGLVDWVELRLDGPYIKEYTKNKFRLYYELNILVVVQEQNKDAFKINRLTGLTGKLFQDCIEVKKWGEGEEDDGSIFGCLCLVPRPNNERIQTSHFGKINPSVGILQASVEGHYQILID